VAPPQAAVTPLPVRGDAAESPSPTFGEGTPWTGEMLRKVREARGLPIQVIAERTKVTRHHLENIEADRFGLLPAPVYLRGILFGLARELRLDGLKVARSYLERMTAALAPPPSPGPKR
jgi:transcriptional regulator with XRE-family HTH domain